MKQETGSEPIMWGDSIIGFGTYHYKYASGRDAEWFLTGFSPRKQNLTLYIMSGFEEYDDLLGKLGKHSPEGVEAGKKADLCTRCEERLES